MMDLGLENKVGIITGASRGIGAEIARELAREGCAVVLAARSADGLAKVAAELRGLGARALTFPVDLREGDGAAKLVAAAVAEFGRIDFLVANAGTARMGDFLELTDEDWQEGFSLKFFGHLRLIRSAWSHLKAAKGSIIIIAGIAGRTPAAGSMITGSVNAALLGFTKALAARALADGIQVNAINPGMTRTDRYTGRLRKTAQALGVDEAQAERVMIAEAQVSRVGEPSDVAGLAAFILGRRGRYLHGALIDIDGGRTKGL